MLTVNEMLFSLQSYYRQIDRGLLGTEEVAPNFSEADKIDKTLLSIVISKPIVKASARWAPRSLRDRKHRQRRAKFD